MKSEKENSHENTSQAAEKISKDKFACHLILIFNFMSAIIKDGSAPFLSIYLVSARGWTPGEAGIIWLIRDLSMVISQIPIGDLIDKTHKKKTILIIASLVFAICANVIIFTVELWILSIKSIFEGIAASAIDPGKNAITLGIIGIDKFEKQTSLNEMANHSGTLFSVATCGIIAFFIYPNTQWLFIGMGVTALISILSIYLIPNKLIQHDVARNININNDNDEQYIVSYWVIIKDISIMMLIFSIFIFHLSNATILPLVGQIIANEEGRNGLPFASLLIIIGQLTSIPSAWFAERYSKQIGYKLVMCIGYISVTIRCGIILLILQFSDNRNILIITQILDGVGAGIINLSIITVTRMLTDGTGRFNVTFGLVNTAWGLGASLSNLLGGFLANNDYKLAFIVLAIISIIPTISTIFGIKEPKKKQNHHDINI